MSVTAEQLERIAGISEKEHIHIIDSFAALGRDPETIAIRQGIDLEEVLLIIRAYGLQAGAEWGDEHDDRGIWKRTHAKEVQEFVEQRYPGESAEK